MPRFRARLAAMTAAAALCLLNCTTASTHAEAAGSLRWVALGDSYTAGVIHATGPTFEQPRDGCQRTTGSYPEVIKRHLGPQIDLRNVSCGNATIAEVTHNRQTPIGYQLHIPGVVDIHDPDYPFDPVAPQVDALDPDTDVVTVGVGGNSLGFGEILGKCVSLGPTGGIGSSPCKDYYTSGTTETIEDRLQHVAHEYDVMLTAIHHRAPFARVVTVGYPAVIPDNAANCLYGNLLQFATIRHADLNWLRDSVLQPLNAAIHSESGKHGDTYVDVYTSSKGHSVCAGGQDKWIEGIKERLGDDDNPNTWALVHPNSRGHANAAARVEDAILGG
ncbi:SGNH/GDSL hydrolase family protein [Streptomyces sp. NPDC052036]|uniref:SGNH/GDSL hydrolase family protein n=1 Tax=unclassified Streptomyces TaxID=2593676 RepID=UPI0034201CE8